MPIGMRESKRIKKIENNVYGCTYQNMQDTIWRHTGRLHIKNHKIHFGHHQRKIHNIQFEHLIVLISHNSNHTTSNLNWKWTCLNATPLMRLLTMKPPTKEDSLKDIEIYPTIYKGKETWSQNSKKNWIGVQSRPLKSTILLRGESFNEVCDAMWRRGNNIGGYKWRITAKIGKFPQGRVYQTFWKPKHMQ